MIFKTEYICSFIIGNFNKYLLKFLMTSFFLILFSTLGAQVGQQKIIRLEWFIDTDPGFGKAETISINEEANIETPVSQIDVSNLSDGIHRVFARVQTDSANWSITQSRAFYRIRVRVAPNIVRLEYFVDTDPGIGNAKRIDVYPDININEYPVNIETDETANGMHTLYIRALDTEGHWSITQQRTFQQFYQHVTPDLTGLEYFIDHDPGFGNGTAMSLSGQEENRLVSVDITAQQPGMHTLHVRARNQWLAWSITHSINFVKADMSSESEIRKVEYFVDRDPGFGNACPVSISPGKSITTTFPVDADTLGAGLHTLYVRACNAEGRWTVTQHFSFVRMKKELPADIVAYEWFIDHDPGFGNAPSYTSVTPSPQFAQNVPIDVSGLNAGMHWLYFRALDNRGRWSIVQYIPFICAVAPEQEQVSALEWFIDADPGFGNAHPFPVGEATVNVPIHTSALEPGVHTLYIRARYPGGRWSITQNISFVLMREDKVFNVTELEYFIDEDPGVGSGTAVPVATPGLQVIQPFTVDISQTEQGLHRLFVRARNEAGKWSVTQYNDFVKITPPPKASLAKMEWFINSDPGFGQAEPVFLSGGNADGSFILNLAEMINNNTLTANTIHTLYVRASDNLGRWSVTQVEDFFLFEDTSLIDDVEEIEWFLDTDPGYGAANSLTFAPQRTVIQAFSVNVAALPEGWHQLFVRARNTAGRWSITHYCPFVKAKVRNLSAMEYFIDTDKGFGNNHPVTVNNGTNDFVAFNISTAEMSALNDGFHTLYVRVKDQAGSWGVTQYFNFVKVSPALIPSAVSGVEWFVDTDPGFGAANAASVAANGVAVLHLDGDDYTEGVHTLYVRALNQAGVWGISQYFPFYVMRMEPEHGITALEWFIDADPGFGQANIETLVESPQIGRQVIVPVALLEEGLHRIYVRVRTSDGLWSITQMKQFQKIRVPDLADLAAVEYFIDADPGFGNGTAIPVGGQADDKSFIVLLDHLPAGVHTLYVRACNTLKHWSITHSLVFIMSEIPEDFRIPDVTAVEYFIDSDPGYRNATRVYFDNAGQNVQKTFAVPVSGLLPGIHTFYVRAVNETGKWGVTHRQTFILTDIPDNYQPAKMVRMEYFIDSDPGFEQGISVALPSESSTGALFNVNLSEYGDGPHTLYVRALDDKGKWSITQTLNFYRTDLPLNLNKDIIYMEYFIDNDPGFGSGEEVVLLHPGEDVDQSVFISTNDMWPGAHVIYFRALDARGLWSITQHVELLVVDNPRLGGYPDIVKMEYFIDNDPGFGEAHLVAANPQGLNITQRFFISLTDISEGIHTVYIRGCNSKGEWSHTHSIMIYNMGIPLFEAQRNITGFEYFVDTDPGVGMTGNYVTALSPGANTQQQLTVTADTLSEGLHAIYVRAVDSEGNWSHTQRRSFLHVRFRPLYPVTKVEYFINDDPGFGNAHDVAITAGHDVDRTFNVSLPDSLPHGFHTLYVRACNEAGEWSITHFIHFTKIEIRKIPDIVALEYFIDADPGFGAADPMPVPVGDVPVSMFLPLTGLDEGVHTLYIRAKNSEGVWSITQYLEFTSILVVRNIKIVAVEYFVDDDPGFGNAIPVQGIVPDVAVSKIFSVDLTGFEPGIHTLYVRALDEKGNWSITQDMTFIRLEDLRTPNIVKAEYFIDDAVDFGNGTDIPVTAGEQVQKTVTVNTSALEDGLHTVYVRVKDDDGKWSITQYRHFVKQTPTAADSVKMIEWFVDNDPGFGNAQTVTVTNGASVIFPVNIPLTDGFHTLYVRSSTGKGEWSITQHLTFTLINEELPVNIVAYEWFIDDDPGFGNATGEDLVAPVAQLTKIVPVDVSGLPQGLHRMYVRVLDSDGNWSITQHQTFIRVTLPQRYPVEALEWFVDSDPGFGNAHTVTTGASEVNITIDEGIDPGIHTLYVRAKNNRNVWSITQNISFVSMRPEDLSQVTALEYFLDSDPGYGNATSVHIDVIGVRVAQTFVVDISQADDGLHTLYVRALDTKGRWSVTQYNSFVKVTPPEKTDVAAIEWFVDNDPGFGQAERINVQADDHAYVLNLTDTGLSNGTHELYVRSVDLSGRWSITQYIQFVLFRDTSNIASIAEIEWYVDTDPGYGNAPAAQRFVYADPQRVVIQPFHVDITGLQEGLHHLFVRAKDTLGIWGLTQYESFVIVKSREAVAMEWFVDTDQGFGNNHFLPVSSGPYTSFTVPSAGLGDGIHTLYVRAQDEAGSWGVTQHLTFVKVTEVLEASGVERAEWFIDGDPGFGQGHAVGVTNAGTAVFTVSDAMFDAGMHTLYVRALNKTGHWGITQHFPFYTMETEDTTEITAMEWFIDVDPGFGLAAGVPVIADRQIVRTVTVPLGAVAEGIHRIYTRVRTSDGQWSITQYVDFVKVISPSQPEKMVEVEYFVDNDPGFGQGFKVGGVVPGTSITASFVVDIYNHTEGVHTLYVRSKSESGRWSITHNITFIKVALMHTAMPELAKLEYFFDTDPGYGNATDIPLSGDRITKTFNVQLPADMQQGVHTLFVRAMDTLKHWSITQYSQFITIDKRETPNTVAVEYFIDNDPGFGKAMRRNVIPGVSFTEDFIIGLDTVPEGVHTLYVRAVDAAGHWSVTHSITFLKWQMVELSDVMAMEWFIDEDPGYGNAQPIPAFPAAGMVSRTFSVSLTGITDGVHTFFVRAKNNENHWSVTQYQSFSKITARILPKATAVEYFMDTDPGFGHGTRLVVTPASHEHTAYIYLYAEDLSVGLHTLYVRTLDSEGQWSVTQNMDMIVMDLRQRTPSKVMALEYFFDTDPGFGNGKRVNISPTQLDIDRHFFVPAGELSVMNDGVHTLYLRALSEDQQWSITHSIHIVKVSEIKVVPDDVVFIEYFFDNDPGFGQAKRVNVSPSDNITKIFSVDMTGVAVGPHILYVRAVSENGRWAITQFKDEINVAMFDPEEEEEAPKGGVLTPTLTEICQYSGASVTLTLTGYEMSINWWEYRRNDEDGAPVFGWSVVSNSANRSSMTFTPNEPGTWEYRVHVSRGDRGPEYSTTGKIIVVGAAKGGTVTANIPQYVCSGKSFDLTLEDYKGEIAGWMYRYVFEGNVPVLWTPIPGTEGLESITVTPDKGGEWQYRAEVKMGECSNAFSTELTVAVIDAMTGGHVLPDTMTACPGKDFELEARDYLGDIIAWERSVDGGNTWTRFTHTDKFYHVNSPVTGELQYRAVIQAGNCDETVSTPSVIYVVDQMGEVGDIVGPDRICKPDTQRYYIDRIEFAESYIWTVPAGVMFNSDPSAREVWLIFPDNNAVVGGTITVKGHTDLCGDSDAATLALTVNARPDKPVISGASEVCVGEEYTYTIPALNSNETCVWNVPAGWTVLTTNGNVITVIPHGLSGDITVTVTNTDTGCTGEQGVKSVIMGQAIQTGPIYRLPNRW
jgi:hypothetical protein